MQTQLRTSCDSIRRRSIKRFSIYDYCAQHRLLLLLLLLHQGFQTKQISYNGGSIFLDPRINNNIST